MIDGKTNQVLARTLSEYEASTGRIRARLNVCIDAFANEARQAEGKTIGQLVEELTGDRASWHELMRRRDAIANALATLIEADPRVAARYQLYCENLKNPRSLRAML